MGFFSSYTSNDNEDNQIREKIRDLEGCLRELERDYYSIKCEIEYLKRGLRSAEMGNNDRLVRDYEQDIKNQEYQLEYVKNKISNIQYDIRYYNS